MEGCKMYKVALKIVLGFCLSVAAVFAQAAPTGLPEQMIPNTMGVNIHFKGSNPKRVAQLAEVGFRFIRLDMFWSTCEKTKGTYNFEAYDALMSSLDEKGIRPLFILDYGNKLYNNGQSPSTPESRAAYAAYAGAAAAHFKGRGVIWEIWNEPNGKTFWRPEPNPQHYTEMAKAAYKAIKAADPGAIVAGPATSGFAFSFIEKCFAYGMLECADAVSVHPYRAAGPESAIPEYQQLKDLIKRYAPKGKEIPIISSEWGYNTVEKSETTQAQFAVRMFLVNLMSDVKLSIWYDWRDDGISPTNKEHHFGVVYNDFSPKPIYNAIKVLTRELDRCKLVSRLAGKDDEYILLFKGPLGYRIAAWTNGEEREISIPTDSKNVPMVTMNGDAADISSHDGRLTFKISKSPVYIELGQNDRMSLEEALTLKANVDTRWRIQDVVTATVNNPLPHRIKGTLVMAIPGKKPETKRINLDAGKSISFRFTPDVTWDGRSGLIAEGTVNIEGIKEPVVRQINLDTNHRIAAAPACPLSRIIEFRIVSPMMNKVKGKVKLFDVKGIKPKTAYVPFEVETQTVVGFTLEEPAPKQFAFGYELIDGTGKAILRSPVMNYTVIEDFSSIADGKPVSDYEVMLGDGADEAGTVFADGYMIDTPYTSLPKIPSCRLRYDIKEDPGFFKLMPHKDVPIAQKPVEVGMWIRGDGTGEVARCRFVDSNGQTFQPEGFKIDWLGWRYKSMPLNGSNCGFWGGPADGKPQPPYKWDSIFLLDSAGKSSRGTIYIGPMMLVSEPEKQPATETAASKK